MSHTFLLPDDLGFLQLGSNEVLCAVARGELDLNALAVRELRSRGFDPNGNCVGFTDQEEQ